MNTLQPSSIRFGILSQDQKKKLARAQEDYTARVFDKYVPKTNDLSPDIPEMGSEFCDELLQALGDSFGPPLLGPPSAQDQAAARRALDTTVERLQAMDAFRVPERVVDTIVEHYQRLRRYQRY